MDTDYDELIREYGDIFPIDWDYQDIVNFMSRYIMSNIDHIEEMLEDNE